MIVSLLESAYCFATLTTPATMRKKWLKILLTTTTFILAESLRKVLTAHLLNTLINCVWITQFTLLSILKCLSRIFVGRLGFILLLTLSIYSKNITAKRLINLGDRSRAFGNRKGAASCPCRGCGGNRSDLPLSPDPSDRHGRLDGLRQISEKG